LKEDDRIFHPEALLANRVSRNQSGNITPASNFDEGQGLAINIPHHLDAMVQVLKEKARITNRWVKTNGGKSRRKYYHAG